MLVLLIVVGIPGHEFPQPFDHVIRGDAVISSSVSGANNSDVVFFRDSTLLLVGPIPVQFGKYIPYIAGNFRGTNISWFSWFNP